MNEFHAIALEYKEGRTPIFEDVLKNIEYIDSPWILEIGGFRATLPEHISGDGFSIFYWAEFLAKKGSGRLTIVDIDPVAVERTKSVLTNFDGKVNIEVICGDGLEYLKQLNKVNSNPSLVYLDGPDQEWVTYECFRLLNGTKTAVLCDDANGWETGRGKCVRLRRNYVNYILHKVGPTHEMIYYPLIKDNEKSFKIGELELDYVRENVNSAWRNCRSIELALGKWFSEKFNNNIVELGAVCHQYSFYKDWETVDPYDNWDKCVRKDILEYDYSNKNILSISTVEHVGLDMGYNQPKIEDLAIRGLQKIVSESNNYLITIPVGANRPLEDFLRSQSDIKYTFMQRNSYRSDTNNWTQKDDNELFYLPYFHFDYAAGYFGCTGAIVVITNQQEILNKL